MVQLSFGIHSLFGFVMADSNNSSSNPQELVSDSNLLAEKVILVADDEELMREVVSIMIEENGGTVLTAADGEEALEVFKKNRDRVDYLFLDFSMPGLDGYEAYVEMIKLKPEVRALFVSGLSITPEVQELVNKNQAAFLGKPFHEAELLDTLGKL